MQLGFFHPSLAIRVVKKCEHDVERLFRITDNIGKGLALWVRQKIVSRDADFLHGASLCRKKNDF